MLAIPCWLRFLSLLGDIPYDNPASILLSTPVNSCHVWFLSGRAWPASRHPLCVLLVSVPVANSDCAVAGEVRNLQRTLNGNGERGLVANVANLIDDMHDVKADMKSVKNDVAELKKAENERVIVRATEHLLFKRAMAAIWVLLSLLIAGGASLGSRILQILDSMK